MKYILYSTFLICSVSCTHQTKEVSINQEPAVVNSTSSPEQDLEFEADELFPLIEKYNETGNAEHLVKVLEYYQNSMEQDYVETSNPMYCGLTLELMGEDTSARKYYTKTLELAKNRLGNPELGVAREFDAANEEELSEIFKRNNVQLDISELKTKYSKIQNYWLYLSQVALGEDKYDEINTLIHGNNDSQMPFGMFEVKQRNDLFKLITGWEN